MSGAATGSTRSAICLRACAASGDVEKKCEGVRPRKSSVPRKTVTNTGRIRVSSSASSLVGEMKIRGKFFPHFSPFFPTIKSRIHQKICHIQVLTHLALTSRPLERHVSTDIATFRCGRPQTVTSMYPKALPTSARPANTFLEALAQDFHRQQLAFIISSVIH